MASAGRGRLGAQLLRCMGWKEDGKQREVILPTGHTNRQGLGTTLAAARLQTDAADPEQTHTAVPLRTARSHYHSEPFSHLDKSGESPNNIQSSKSSSLSSTLSSSSSTSSSSTLSTLSSSTLSTLSSSTLSTSSSSTLSTSSSSTLSNNQSLNNQTTFFSHTTFSNSVEDDRRPGELDSRIETLLGLCDATAALKQRSVELFDAAVAPGSRVALADVSGLLSEWERLRRENSRWFEVFRLGELCLASAQAPLEAWLDERRSLPVDETVAAFCELRASCPLLFDSLADRYLVPVLRGYLLHGWQPAVDGAEPAFRALRAYAGLSAAAFEATTAAIIQRLRAAVEQTRLSFGDEHDWPGWLFPWLKALRHDSRPLLDAVEDRLTAALRQRSDSAWLADSHDGGAVAATLRLWADQLGGRLDSVVRAAVLPPLRHFLLQLPVDDAEAQAPRLRQCLLNWLPLVAAPALASDLVAYFFRRWHDALRRQLLGAQAADFLRVRAWYLSWRAALCPAVIACDVVQAQLRPALQHIDQQLDLFIMTHHRRSVS